MARKKASSIATLRYYKNSTRTGKKTTAKIDRSVYYYAYGLTSEADEQQRRQIRGIWHGPDGIVGHKDVRQWAEEKALEHKYTYTAVLSIREGQLTPDDYLQTMRAAGHVQDWRLIQHQDSDHDHAHVIFFADKTMSRKITRAWNKSARAELEMLQALRLQEEEEQAQQEQRRRGLSLE